MAPHEEDTPAAERGHERRAGLLWAASLCDVMAAAADSRATGAEGHGEPLEAQAERNDAACYRRVAERIREEAGL